MDNQTERKWYQKPVTVILFLIFFFPVGLYLMWKYDLWSKTTQVVVSVFFGNHYKKNPEADGLIAANAAKSFENEMDAAQFLIQILQENPSEIISKMGENAARFIEIQPNSTEIIVAKMMENLS